MESKVEERNVRLTYKYRAYANKETTTNAERWLELMRQLYNAALEERIWAWKMQRKSLSRIDQQNEMPQIRAEFAEYKDIDAQSLRTPLRILDLSFQSFFRRMKQGQAPGFPRFKGKGRFNSFVMEQNGWKLDGNHLSIRNVGVFKLRLSRLISGDIKTITMRVDSVGHWYVCFSCDNVPIKPLPKSDKSIGLDVGISSFLTDSNGGKVENPKCFRQAQAILRRKQRVMSRRKKGSNRRNKARIQVARCHDKIQRQRADFLHKTANHYIAEYGMIAVEDLNVRGMVKNRHLSKSIADASWSRFFNLLSYKAECAGRTLVKVRPHGTSQICSQCGEKVPKSLGERTHSCPHCGLVMDRDENAARNILRLGQSLQALTCADTQSIACELEEI